MSLDAVAAVYELLEDVLVDVLEDVLEEVLEEVLELVDVLVISSVHDTIRTVAAMRMITVKMITKIDFFSISGLLHNVRCPFLAKSYPGKSNYTFST